VYFIALSKHTPLSAGFPGGRRALGARCSEGDLSCVLADEHLWTESFEYRLQMLMTPSSFFYFLPSNIADEPHSYQVHDVPLKAALRDPIIWVQSKYSVIDLNKAFSLTDEPNLKLWRMDVFMWCFVPQLDQWVWCYTCGSCPHESGARSLVESPGWLSSLQRKAALSTVAVLPSGGYSWPWPTRSHAALSTRRTWKTAFPRSSNVPRTL